MDRKSFCYKLLILGGISVSNLKKWTEQGGNSLSGLRRMSMLSIVCDQWSCAQNHHQLLGFPKYPGIPGTTYIDP